MPSIFFFLYNTYSFKVAPLNALGRGVLSEAMDTIVATSGSSATYTTVTGSSLVTGITDDVDEAQTDIKSYISIIIMLWIFFIFF